MNFCCDGGYVVNVATPIPDDPTDFSIARLPPTACNRLRCGSCGAMVRNAAGVALVPGHDKSQVYDAPDLLASEWVVKDLPQFRLYLCRCSAWSEQFRHKLDNPDFDHLTDPGVPWRCAGHPPVELPHDFDGERVTGEADLEALVARALTGWVPDAARPELRKGARWIAQLHGRLAGTPWQDTVARAAAERLDDPSPTTRAHALQFTFRAPRPEAQRRILELLDGDRALFAGVPDEVTGIDVGNQPTLEDTMWRALGNLVGQSERARALARKDALTPGRGRRALFDALARHDSDWLTGHAGEVVRANPTAAGELVEAALDEFPEGVPTTALRDNVKAALSQIKA